eukprot:TRINITY_DN42526_c0_g1_i1.p1 TRINITY_DN42526_c0_g1~~TRINITY_DN42526_c0_g1_i1.p1  ORF type:complete len:345 (+),score=48.81 TRINITY_DN42526_c0_g1_i1:15-1049(+)
MSQQNEQLEHYREQLRDIKLKRFGDTTPILPQIASSDSKDCSNDDKRQLLLKIRRRFAHFGVIYGLAWGPDSQHLVSASQDAMVYIWNAKANVKKQTITLPSAWSMCCDYSPTGELVSVAGLDGLVRLCKVTTGAITCELSGHEGYVSSCSFARGGTQMITTSGDSSAALWDLETSKVLTRYIEHSADVNCSAVDAASGGYVFTTGSCDSAVKLWDTRQEPNSFRTFVGHDSDVNGLSFFPDGNAIVSGSHDSTCRLFDIRSYSVLNVFKRAERQVTSVGVSRSGRFVFTAYDTGPVCGWNTLFGNLETQLDGHDRRVSRVQVSNDGSAIATASWDLTILVWAP